MADQQLAGVANPLNIFILATACSQSLDKTAIAASANEETTLLHDQIDDEKRRFWVWASNLGALHTVQSPKSLDFRLQDSHRMRQTVINGLERLRDVSNRLYDIISDNSPNRIAEYTHDTADSDTKETTSEINELRLGVHSTISHLFSLSMLVRRQRPNGRLPNPDHFVPQEHSPDITHVKDKYPKLVHSPWLMKKLGNTITMRREALQYRQFHRKALSAQSKPGDVVDLRSDNITEIVATTFVDSTNNQQEPRTELANRQDHQSFFTSATSFMSRYNNLNDIESCITDLSDMTLDGVALQYGEPFECPFCRTIQNVSNKIEWKKHIFSDLQPYVCTFENCLSQPFESRHEWFQHELENHRRQMTCIFCNSLTTVYSDKIDMVNHLRDSHAGDVTDAQLPWLLQACDRPVLCSKTFDCLFCDQWNQNAEDMEIAEFGRHIARHLRALSLASLPLAIDGLEIVSHDPEGKQTPNTDSTFNFLRISSEAKRFSRDERGLNWLSLFRRVDDNTPPREPFNLIRVSSEARRLGRDGRGLKYGWLNPFRRVDYNAPPRANNSHQPLSRQLSGSGVQHSRQESRDELNANTSWQAPNNSSDPELRYMESRQDATNTGRFRRERSGSV
ncbi:hypothetical protein F4803DRAFT_519612 [Xylaria telfairii]|nr:hypothetical protein F4803DRAFT_519612 [Xylaria telfairii]